MGVVQRTVANGKGGRFITCLTPWFEGHGEHLLSGPARQLFDFVFSSVQPVVIRGPPLMFASARTADATRIVALGNNDANEWRGDVTIRSFSGMGTCVEMLSGEDVAVRSEENELHFSTVVKPYDI